METGTASYSSLDLLAKSLTLTTRSEEFLLDFNFGFFKNKYCALYFLLNFNTLTKESSFYKELKFIIYLIYDFVE